MKKTFFKRACTAVLALTVLAGGAAVVVPQTDIASGITVNAANADNYVENGLHRVFSYKSSPSDVGYKYVVINAPKINLPGDDAALVNNAIQEEAGSVVSEWELALAEQSVGFVTNMDYEAYLNGYILSVVCYKKDNSAHTTYKVYNFDVNTGGKLNRSGFQILGGITDSQLRQSLINAVDSVYFKLADKPDTMPAARDKSISDQNLQQAELFYNSNGKLSAVVTVYNAVTEYPEQVIAELDVQPALGISNTSLSLGEGESFQLKSNIPVMWRTSAPKILTVDSTGKVTAKSTGVAWATARTANGVEKACKITVKAAPTKVDLSKGVVTIGVGEKFSITSTVNAGSASTMRKYRTSNPNVVRLNRSDWQCDFIGVMPGVAYVTVRTYNGKEKACKVTVKAEPSNVIISKKTMTMKVGQTATLTAAVPSDAGCASRIFRTSNPSVIRMTKTNWTGSFKAVSPGVAWVTVRTYNGKEASCKITVTGSGSTGFDASKYEGNLKNERGSMMITKLSNGVYQVNTSLIYLNGNKISSTKYITPINSDRITYTTKDSWYNEYKITLDFIGSNVIFSQQLLKKNPSAIFVAPSESNLVFTKLR